MRALCNQACAVRGLAQPRLFRRCLGHLHPGSNYRAGNIGRPPLVQPLNGKPNLVLALGAVDVNADARQSLDLVLVESEETVCGNGSGWLAPQPRGLLREFDKGENPISFDAHGASHVLTLPMRLAGRFSPLHFRRPHPASIAPLR